ncbi:M48 family metallopeptidase [Reinekea blandensis]|uniref:YgjP-like metallopeptidase domain-containing protein n=1 Tax=Reinekea blandensis MED297 TaxID=314283 RepID=A4BBN3_9GAMM|nr:SprT family zinc-dependent metalloprotease [Reinekea blandensis]EAR10368.1 hypothetical protein MED297_01065 [Reinekea sp. MED297] [Reinekea blandensis MED297]
MTDSLTWQEHTVRVRYSKRKTIALHVQAGQIELRAPYRTDPAFMQAFLRSRDGWLNKAIHEQAIKAQDRIDYSLANRIPFMGFDVAVTRQAQQKRPTWSLTPEGLSLTLPDPDDAETNLHLLADFYQSQARFWLPKKTRERAETGNLLSQLKDVRLRKTKTKWGHCTHDGRIQYNWLIMMAPERVIDYLVSHEVSHLKHLNHSSAFWQQVEALHPNYQADRRWLRRHEHRLTLDHRAES